MIHLMRSILLGWFSVCLPLVGEKLSDHIPLSSQIGGEEEGVFHQAQGANDGVLVLNATNGFFDKGKIRAVGQKTGQEHDKNLIKASFDDLQFLPGKNDATARWYLWAEKAGEVKVSIRWGEGFKSLVDGDTWILSGKDGKVSHEFDGRGQPLEITLPVRVGKQTIEFRRDGGHKTTTSVKSLTLSGDHVEHLKLLRARWRPAAIHTRYGATGCEEPVMWVFESRSACEVSSYSPMTTGFGYFGATFGAGRRAAGEVNFSMWAVSQKAGKDNLPPLADMPHLLATGNPEAEFSGFGHEGAGVKIRNWTPYAHQPGSVIQALRVENNGIYHTYYGYLFDEREKRWVLYAMGNKIPKKNAPAKVRATSFCEVPGPPQVERTGDLERVIERRGWLFDGEGKMFPVDQMATKAHYQNHEISMSDDHWFQMKTGGLDFREVPGKVASDFKHPLPEYLKPEAFKQLYELPTNIGKSEVGQVTGNSATITYPVKKAGTRATGVLWFGAVDGITFVPRKLHGTERGRMSEDLFSKDRVWSFQTPEKEMKNGKNLFSLGGLKPGTKYFYRLFVKNERGKCWASESDSFTTN
jgi:hypothetical protein